MAHDVSEVTDTSSAVVLNEKLWVAEDGSVVKDGDPRAATLIGPAGYRLSREDAIGYGLIKPSADEKKQMAAGESGPAAESASDPNVFSEEKATVTKQDRPKANKQRSASKNKSKG